MIFKDETLKIVTNTFLQCGCFDVRFMGKFWFEVLGLPFQLQVAHSEFYHFSSVSLVLRSCGSCL